MVGAACVWGMYVALRLDACQQDESLELLGVQLCLLFVSRISGFAWCNAGTGYCTVNCGLIVSGLTPPPAACLLMGLLSCGC